MSLLSLDFQRILSKITSIHYKSFIVIYSSNWLRHVLPCTINVPFLSNMINGRQNVKKKFPPNKMYLRFNKVNKGTQPFKRQQL